MVENTVLVLEGNLWDYIEGHYEYYKEEVIVVDCEIALKGRNLEVLNRRFFGD